MAQYVEVQGNVIEFPDGMPAGEIESAIKANLSSIKPAAAVRAGKTVNSFAPQALRQAGLTARYGLEGLANMAQIVTEPIRYGMDRATEFVTGSPPKTVPLGVLASRAADAVGLPSPRGANERVVGDASRLVAGAGGMGAVARGTAALPGMAGEVAGLLGSNMGMQAASAAGSGLAGGASREGGGSTVDQFAASLVGGIGGGVAANAAGGLKDAAVSGMRALRARMNPQQLDQQINILFERAGMDWSALPGTARTALRQDLADALNTGREVNPDALRRLADFRSVGATPTRGMISQDPVQITREMNLAKTGANSADDSLGGLARVQNQNNAAFIRNLDTMGATQGDQFRAGQSVVGSILGRDAAMERNASNLYAQARDTAGRPALMDHAAFTRNANAALDEAMLGYALPGDVRNRLNRIAMGQEGPFNVEYVETLKKQLNALSGSTNDRAVQRAIRTVRTALDDAPLMPAPTVNLGNLPAVPGTVPPSPASLGRESLDAFGRARAAHRDRMQWQESGRPVQAAIDGAQPDKFVQQFVVNGTLDDARAVAQNAPTGEVRNAILQHLKGKALSGATSEVGKFSQSAYNNAVQAIGERKLALYFTQEEIAQLRALGRASSYAMNQPVGSAVNNSNSAAMIFGKGLDALAGLANAAPVIGPLFTQPLTNGIRNLNIAVQTSRAQSPAAGLLMPSAQRPSVAQGLLLPAAAAGGLLAAP